MFISTFTCVTIEAYLNEVALSLQLEYTDTKCYLPSCVFFDATNVTYTGSKAIKEWMLHLFSPFIKFDFEEVNFLVVDESDPDRAKYTVNAELMFKFYLKGDTEPVSSQDVRI